MEKLEMTGKVRHIYDWYILYPVEGDLGYWTPSDQNVCPITPIKCIYKDGEWQSVFRLNQ